MVVVTPNLKSSKSSTCIHSLLTTKKNQCTYCHEQSILRKKSLQKESPPWKIWPFKAWSRCVLMSVTFHRVFITFGVDMTFSYFSLACIPQAKQKVYQHQQRWHSLKHAARLQPVWLTKQCRVDSKCSRCCLLKDSLSKSSNVVQKRIQLKGSSHLRFKLKTISWAGLKRTWIENNFLSRWKEHDLL